MDQLNQLKDSEYKVIEILNNNNNATQRDIAQKTGLSLGLTNIIIKRLITKGFVKVKNMNKKKILYHLTPKAMIEKTQRTYNYFERTVKDVVSIKEKIQKAIIQKWNGQFNEIIIVGKDEIKEIAKWAVQNLNHQGIIISQQHDEKELNERTILVINCDKNVVEQENYINIYEII